MNSKITLESTSKQGALSQVGADKNVEYTVKLVMKEGKWNKSRPIIFEFFTSSCVFFYNYKPRYRGAHKIREDSRKSTPYNTYKEISVRFWHTFETAADKDNFIRELTEN
jgi:uncharacterized protein (DUF1330 family)